MFRYSHIIIDVRVVLEQNGNILKLEVNMILTPDMATEVGEALLDAASNSNGDNKSVIDVVLVSNNLAVSMPSTDDDHGYTIIHQVQS